MTSALPKPSVVEIPFMKRSTLSVTMVVIFLACTFRLIGQEKERNPPRPEAAIGEYATVRFMEERTSIVWPDGTVENVMELVPKKKFEGGEKYPKSSDYRMYWLTIAMNYMAQRGYELTHMNDRDVVMVRRFKKS